MKRHLPLLCLSALLLAGVTQSRADAPPAQPAAVPAEAPAAAVTLPAHAAPAPDPLANTSPTAPTLDPNPEVAHTGDHARPLTDLSNPQVNAPLPAPKVIKRRAPYYEHPKRKSMIETQREWLANNKIEDQRNKYEPPNLTVIKPETRPCSEPDIVNGMWKMIYYREDPPAIADKYNRRQKYQYLSFSTLKTYTRIKSARSIDDQEQALRYIKQGVNPQSPQKFILNETDTKSEIIFMLNKQAIIRQSCSVVLKPMAPFKPNDVILTGYTPGGKTLLYELYRRWF